MTEDETSPPSTSRDGWILWVVLIFALVSVVSFLSARSDRGGEQARDEPWIVEEFSASRMDLSTSTLSNGHRWVLDGGTYAVADGAATATAAADHSAFATVRFAEPPTVVSVLVNSTHPGSGVTFGFVDATKYWSVEGNGDATWSVYQMTGLGKLLLAHSEPSASTSGAMIEIRRIDGRVQVQINGRLVPALIPDAVPIDSAAGLLAGPGEQGQTEWTRFLVSGAVPEGAVPEGAGSGGAAPEASDVPTSSTTPSSVVATREPGAVHVLVLNGAGVPGLARSVVDTLGALGYQMAPPGDTATPVLTTIVYVTAGYEREASELATHLAPAGVPVEALPADPGFARGSAEVVVVLGADAGNTNR